MSGVRGYLFCCRFENRLVKHVTPYSLLYVAQSVCRDIIYEENHNTMTIYRHTCNDIGRDTFN